MPDRERCTGRSREGKPCRNYPPKDWPEVKVCKFHGGAAPQVLAKAARDRLENDLKKTLDRLEIVPIGDPLTELSKLAGEVVAWKELLRAKVEALQGKIRYPTEYNEAIRGEVILYERAMDRCSQVLGLIAKLNIDERLAAIDERMAASLEEALFAAFDAAGLTLADADTKEAVAREFSRRLTVVASTAA